MREDARSLAQRATAAVASGSRARRYLVWGGAACAVHCARSLVIGTGSVGQSAGAIGGLWLAVAAGVAMTTAGLLAVGGPHGRLGADPRHPASGLAVRLSVTVGTLDWSLDAPIGQQRGAVRAAGQVCGAMESSNSQRHTTSGITVPRSGRGVRREAR